MPFSRVPDINAFKEKWRTLMSHGLRNQTQRSEARFELLPVSRTRDRPRLKMVVGIFSRQDEQDRPYRDVIRSTWMQQPMVCPLQMLGDNKSDCKIFVTFVVGRPSGTASSHGTVTMCKNNTGVEESKNETDLTALDVLENMDCGKTRAWFDYGAHRYQEATHIAKMDMDAFVQVPNLLNIMERFPDSGCPNIFGGRSWNCPSRRFCPPHGCGFPTGTDWWHYAGDNPECYSYMQGGFYFMSRSMARGVARRDGWWDRRSSKCEPEDAIAGWAIKVWGTEGPQQRCVTVVNLRGQEVIWHPDYPPIWRGSLLPV